MKAFLETRWGAFSCLLASVAILLSIAFTYHLFIQERNEHFGYLAISYAVFDYFVMAIAVLVLSLSLRQGTQRPSDYFFFLYSLFVIVPYCVLFNIRGNSDCSTVLIAVFLLISPLLFLGLTRRISVSIRYQGVMTWRQTRLVAYGLVMVAVYLLLTSGISSAGFDMATSYDRRLEGRGAFQTGAAASYIVSMVANSMLPLIAFWAGYGRRFFMFFVAISGCVLLFFYLGLKAPFLYVIVGAGFGRLGGETGFRGMDRLFICVVLIAFAISFVEIGVDGYSYFADYIIRRAFTVPPFLVSAYMELFFHSSGHWDIEQGLLSNQQVSLFIGEYLGDPTLNANTNTFIYAFGSFGLYGYMLDIALVCVVFWFIDHLYLQRRDPALVWTGFLFSLLLVEQSSKTVLVSSGIALCLVLLCLKRSQSGALENR